ncbi:MAG TPA: twin-arginine translocase TatA/TatE family subunit [Anaerolineae bacterium]|nr:twin-arginine translocase TatA/TatE family subunit [Anaerolineae bacterium]
MPNLGPTELIIILIIVILIFGAGKLPEIGGALGKGIKEFKTASKELEEATDEVKSVTSPKKDEESDQG